MGWNIFKKKDAGKKRKKAILFFDGGMEEFYKTGNFFNAVSNFQKAVEIDAGFFDAWLRLGLVYYRMDKYDDAVGCFDKCIHIAEGDAGDRGCNPLYQAYYNKGLSLYKKEEFKKALFNFKKSEKLMPEEYRKGGSVEGWMERCTSSIAEG